MTHVRHMMQTAAMSQAAYEAGTIPPETMGWRMQRSLSFAGVSVQEMADELGVSRGTISRWCNDKNRPRRSDLRLWALRCGVPLDWLQNGVEPQESAKRSTIMHIRGDQLVLNEISAQAKPLNSDAVTELRRSLGHGTRQTNRRVRPADQRITHPAARS